MSNFIKNYFVKLHNSDEKTKHRSALTISVVLSAVILAIVFMFIKNSFLSLPKNINSNPEDNQALTNKDEVKSPIQSFSDFFDEAGKQFSKAKDLFNNVSSIKNSKDIIDNSQ